MNPRPDGQLFPRGALLGAGLLIAFTILIAGVTRVVDVGTVRYNPAAVDDSVAVRFADRDDGAVVVYAADSDRLLIELAPGTNGFVRGVMRGLARERRQYGVGPEVPFELTRVGERGLLIRDPGTERVIDLRAFGLENLAAFRAVYDAAYE